MTVNKQYPNIKSLEKLRKDHYTLNATFEWLAFDLKYLTYEDELLEDRQIDG